MDLVFVTDAHHRGGPPVLNATKNQMYNLARQLKARGLALDTLVIPKARVPIIKFTDLRTGLPVDISFENMSGLVAQSTLSQWRTEFGDHFTYLVALSKQLLTMYGLNDNGTGGLGGLSVCCLVASFLQHHQTPENLGETLIQFLDYYGNKFDYSRDRIILDPPSVKRKVSIGSSRLIRDSNGTKGTTGIDGRPERPDRLAIQDPNDPQNNISGGSYKAEQVLQLFSWAHKVLVERMRTVHMDSVHELSILESILGGDYSTYQEQRSRMRNIRIQ
jgi:non-canonical poly(A) RNA polymerase PAPD5/7